MAVIGIIGGSGLNNPEILEESRDIFIDTPYGATSSPLKKGFIKGTPVMLLARHGREHTIPPSEVNYRANIYALKEAGCTHILATTAVGSLREEIKRGDFIIPDQLIDFTKRRISTFYTSFQPHTPIHVSLADPFSKLLREILIQATREIGLPLHETGTLITIEGPRFSTRAESRMFRQWGADIINMSLAPEVALAAEAGIPYGAVAMSTDYDCWKEEEEPVSWQQVLEVFSRNVEKVTTLLCTVIPRIK